MRASLATVVTLAALAVGCGDDKVVKGGDWVTGSAPAAAPAPAAAVPTAKPPTTVAPEFNETDFTEGDRSRDPFRAFAAAATNTRAVVNQRNVLFGEYALEDMRLIAIVQGGESMAMLVDPKGKGTTVHRGDFVGRSEIARTGGVGSTEYQVNWRVDRIRATDVVFVREDPAQPTAAPMTRVLTIHAETDDLPATPK
jgi:type IV pilus assembly protein PilP